ncbi:MAG TPA: DUF6069 family protein [Dermatophilaceae bacterium]
MAGQQFWKRTGLVIAVAVVVNVAVYLIAKAAGVEILVPQGGSPTPLSVVPVVLFTIIPLVLAAVLILVLRRIGRSTQQIFAGVVVVGTALSLLAPLTADLTVSNKLALAAMHVAAGLAALLGLTPLVSTLDSETPVGVASSH